MLSEDLNSVPVELDSEEDQGIVIRRMTLFRVSVITIGGRRELCLIRNISSGGLRAFVSSPVCVGDKVALELKPDETMTATVIWRKEHLIGVQFDRPIDLEAIIGGRFAPDAGQRPRIPRVEFDRLGELRIGGRRYPINSCDIGQGGARIEIDYPLNLGDHVIITLEKFPPIAGTICWYRRGEAGIAFNQIMPFKELLGWMRD